uniref:NADH-ubiquinone oxidoreductase chain 5 n=1 Tax=Hiatella sp. J YW-2023 TaxID=3074278 RepID=A0AA51UHS7_9BIVA|nr:NADH dehydrogenase subunit 5 [Hiatella sp. J YW-2023]
MGSLLWSISSYSYCLFGEVSVTFSSCVDLSFPFILDWASVGFLIVVIFISCNVMSFSSFYMKGDVNKSRFSWLVMMFVGSMVLLISIPNFLILMLGWDGLGLISFLLVITYPTKEALGSGMITFITNRIGDALFIMSIGLLGWLMSWNYFDVEESFGVVKALGCLLVIGSITKSAQTPFSAWLPAAMAAPTPVSALVHSSTLVTAGIYVLIRFTGSISLEWSFMLFLLGTLTSLKGGLSAMFEMDLKKIIAMSTLSQLGLLIQCLGLGSVSVCLFHLMTHALFKSLLFICGGVLIYCNKGVQDLRFISSSYSEFPLISCWMMVSCFSMMGLPFMSGFFSKDLILELMLTSGFSFLIVMMLWVPVILTSVYSLVLLGSSLFKGNMGVCSSKSMEEGLSWLINIPISLLGLSSVFSGVLIMNLFSGVNLSNFFFLSGLLKLMLSWSPMVAVIIFLMYKLSLSDMYYLINGKDFSIFNKTGLKNLEEFVGKMWFIPVLSGSSSSKFLGKNINLGVKQVEGGWAENSMGPKGVESIMKLYLGLFESQSVFIGKYLSFSFCFVVMYLVLMGVMFI